jgi:hypothetical protein
MPTILVSSEALDAMRRRPTGWGRYEVAPRNNGDWDVTINAEAYQYILDNQFPGETCSDAILRLASRVKGGHN